MTKSAAFRRKVCEKSGLEDITVLYRKSLEVIRPGEFNYIKALINEMIGKFWISRNEEIMGKSYLKEAYYLYHQWGAVSKLKLLDEKYPYYLSNSDIRRTCQNRSKSISTDSAELDLLSIFKTTQVIASEIKLEKLMTIIMNTIIENACAQKACLILKNTGDAKLLWKH